MCFCVQGRSHAPMAVWTFCRKQRNIRIGLFLDNSREIPQLCQWEYWPVLADVLRTEVTTATDSYPALHPGLKGCDDILILEIQLGKILEYKLDHYRRSTGYGYCIIRGWSHFVENCGHKACSFIPPRVFCIHCKDEIHIRACFPFLKIFFIAEIRGLSLIHISEPTRPY